MAEHPSLDRLAAAMQSLANEDLPPECLPALSTALEHAARNAQHVPHPTQPAATIFTADGHRLAEHSPHGSLTFFLPPLQSHVVPRRLATFDRRGRLLLLLYRDNAGNLTRFKARGLDGRFLGVERGAASHLGWGMSDSVSLLDGETGFIIAHPLTFFRSVAYEDLDALPPLDDSASLPPPAPKGYNPATEKAALHSSMISKYQDRRLMVLLFDFSSMQPAEQIRAKNAAIQFLTAQMTASDSVSLMVFGSTLRTVQDFTSDRDLLIATINKFHIGDSSEMHLG